TTPSETTRKAFSTGAQMAALSRPRLESGASRVGFVPLAGGKGPPGDPSLPFWGSIQPATSLDPRSGTELFMTGGPEDVFQNNARLDNRIAVWSLTGTQSLAGSSPDVTLRHEVLTSETYGLPIHTPAAHTNGPTPLRDVLNAAPIREKGPLEMINGDDSRMTQVGNVNGILYGGVNTTVTAAVGRPRVGIAFFVVGAVGTPDSLSSHILNQGYVAVAG